MSRVKTKGKSSNQKVRRKLARKNRPRADTTKERVMAYLEWRRIALPHGWASNREVDLFLKASHGGASK
jgi:hypothetical protein